MNGTAELNTTWTKDQVVEDRCHLQVGVLPVSAVTASVATVICHHQQNGRMSMLIHVFRVFPWYLWYVDVTRALANSSYIPSLVPRLFINSPTNGLGTRLVIYLDMKKKYQQGFNWEQWLLALFPGSFPAWQSTTSLWEIHMQTEGSLTGCKCVAGCRTKRNSTQCSVGNISCLNMPKTEGREDMDLTKMVIGKAVTTDITQHKWDYWLGCWSWWGQCKCRWWLQWTWKWLRV